MFLSGWNYLLINNFFDFNLNNILCCFDSVYSDYEKEQNDLFKGVIKMKKGKLIGLIVAVLLVIVGIQACNSDSEVSTGDGTQTQQETKVPKNTLKKSFNDKTVINGLEVTIGEIQVKEKEVKVGMTINNTTGNTLSFYPDHGSVVIGSMQLEANMFLTEGDVSGDIHPGVSKSGVVTFTVPEGKTIDISTVNEIKLHLGQVSNMDSMTFKDYNKTLNMK